MRATVCLDDHLMGMAKREALKRQQSLDSLVEEVLRQWLTCKTVTPETRHHVELPESGQGGLQAGVDLDNDSELLFVIEKRDYTYGR
jgi:hypothetical protein